jgi:hypothetical protein
VHIDITVFEPTLFQVPLEHGELTYFPLSMVLVQELKPVSLPAADIDPATQSAEVYWPTGGLAVQLDRAVLLPRRLKLPAEQIADTKNPLDGEEQGEVTVLLPAKVELPATHTADTQVPDEGELQELNTVSLPTLTELPARHI